MSRKGKIGRDPKVGSSLWSEPDSGLRLWAGHAQSLGGMLRVSDVLCVVFQTVWVILSTVLCLTDIIDHVRE